MGFSNAEAKATLDARFPMAGATDYVAYSSNGTSETSAVARTAVGASGWAEATTADPSVKANNAVLTTAAATAAVTLTHWTVMNASTAGTQRLDWEPFAVSKALGVGDTATWAIGDLEITLT